MAKQLLTPLRLIAYMKFSLKNYSCELFNLIGTVGKVELILTFKSGLHNVVTIAEYAFDEYAPKRILRLSIHRLQIFLVKYEYLRSLQLCKDQGIRENLEKRVYNHVLAILTTYMETRLYNSCLQKLECE